MTTFFVSLLFALSALADNACLQSCNVEPGNGGAAEVVCRCGKVNRLAKAWARGESGAKVFSFVRSRLPFYKQEDIEKVAFNSCAKSAELGRNLTADELADSSQRAQQPLCECVARQVHFKLAKFCRPTIAGEVLCRFSRSKAVAGLPIRSPTLYDYQTCLAERDAYRPPENCADAKCEKAKPSCGAGQELFNVADQGACCPSFVCKEKSVATAKLVPRARHEK